MKKRVLFLCTGNSCRSQMAEGLLRHLAGDKYEVFSAGTNPTPVNPWAIKAMQNIGIDISQHRSNSIDEYKDESFDYVITVCDSAKQACPVFSRGQRIHWSIEDPFDFKGSDDDKLKVYEQCRDILKTKIINFL